MRCVCDVGGVFMGCGMGCAGVQVGCVCVCVRGRVCVFCFVFLCVSSLCDTWIQIMIDKLEYCIHLQLSMFSKSKFFFIHWRFLKMNVYIIGETGACPPSGRVRPPRVSQSRELWKSFKMMSSSRIRRSKLTKNMPQANSVGIQNYSKLKIKFSHHWVWTFCNFEVVIIQRHWNNCLRGYNWMPLTRRP